MLAVYGGVHRRTAIASGCGIIYNRFKVILDIIVFTGYVFVTDGGVYLTERGLQFVNFVLKNWDIFSNDSHLKDDYKQYS